MKESQDKESKEREKAIMPGRCCESPFVNFYHANIGMGAGQSQYESTSAPQDVGRFALSHQETRTMDAISDVMLQLLNNTDMEKLVSTPDGCKSLFLVLSATMEKEFKVLRFPDPGNPNQSTQVSFLTKGAYDQLAEGSSRKILCDQIVYFIIRLITFVAAIAASVRVHPEMSNLLFQYSGEKEATFNARFKTPKIPELSGRDPISSSILEKFTSSGVLHRIKVGEKDDPRPLYYFGAQESVVFDASLSIVYAPLKVETAVLGINIQPYESSGSSQGQGLGGQGQGVDAMRQMEQLRRLKQLEQLDQMKKIDMWGGETRTRKVRKARKARKGSRKTKARQHGGSMLYIVTLRKIFNAPGIQFEPTFVLDDTGNTYEKSEYANFKMTGVAPTAIPFATRVGKILDSESQKYALDTPAEKTTSTTKYGPLSRSGDISTVLKTIEKAIEHQMEGTSPAAYRAFLLSSRMDGNAMNTMFCTDSWAGKRATDVVTYSLLQSLYNDRPEGGMEGATNAMCSDVVNQFLGDRVMSPHIQIGAQASTFDNIAFAKPSEDLLPFCKSVKDQGPRSTQNADIKQTLATAHRTLREMYRVHLSACDKLIKKAIVIDDTKKPVLKFDKVFTTHPRGAQAALEELIAEARTLLSFHYLAVEKVYQDVLRMFGSNASIDRKSKSKM